MLRPGLSRTQEQMAREGVSGMMQMSIFDFLSIDEPFEGKSLEEIAAEVSMLVGVSFKPHVWGWKGEDNVEYIATLSKKNTLELGESTYSTLDERNGKRFIAVGFSFEDSSGGGAPCDSIDEAVKYLRRRKQEYFDRIKNRKRDKDDRSEKSNCEEIAS